MSANKYILYARKSSESAERQVQSIDDQIKVLRSLAQTYNLEIIEVLTEAKSAKEPEKRPVFAEALRLIESGEANGLLCWKYDRLSRNPVDSGKLSYLLQNGTIQEIRTVERTYTPDDNVLLLSVEGGMANQYIRDLSKNVIRGLDSKAAKGWYPGVPPHGYKNEMIEHTIILDEDRAPMIRQMFDLLFAGWSPSQIVTHANEEMGFRSIRRKISGGVTLNKSTLYHMFKNPFYCGYFRWKGELIKGAFEPIISTKEHERAVRLTTKMRQPRSSNERLDIIYRGLMVCGECQCLITGEIKQKHTKNGIREYTYYHCTHRRKDYVCRQPSLNSEEVEKQISTELGKYTIIPQFYEWALESLGELHDEEREEYQKTCELRANAVVEAESELHELTRMRTRKLIDDEEYRKTRASLIIDLAKLKESRNEAELSNEEWAKKLEKQLDFAITAQMRFAQGSHEVKRDIMAMFGQKIILKDKELTLTPVPWLVPILENYKKLESKYLALEPELINQKQMQKKEKAFVEAIHSTWLGMRDSNYIRNIQ